MAAVGLAGTRALAGGPPMLCLPIDGITAVNVDAFTTLLATRLDSKLFPQEGKFRRLEVREFSDQWYVTFYFREDVTLGEVERALKGSSFSIPRDRLRFFGHVVLEIDAGTTAPKDLAAAMDAIEYVSIGELEVKPNRLLLTIDMPYPEKDFRAVPDAIVGAAFQWNDLSSAPSPESDSLATAEQLPTCDTLSERLARRNAKLVDIRWTTAHACRCVGGVAAEDADRKLNTAQAAVAR
jgi:hypothetical protein